MWKVEEGPQALSGATASMSSVHGGEAGEQGEDANLTCDGVVSPPPHGNVILRPTRLLLTNKRRVSAESWGTL